jgi:hypothetical protein
VRGYLAFEYGGYVRGFELPKGVGNGQEDEEKGCGALHGRQGSTGAACACPAVCWDDEIINYERRIKKGNELIVRDLLTLSRIRHSQFLISLPLGTFSPVYFPGIHFLTG